MRHLFIAVLTFGLLTACGTQKESQNLTEKDEILKDKENDNPFQKAIIGEVTEETPVTTINSVKIDGNIMLLEVSYSGGCVEQHFDLVGNPTVMKSFPPKRSVELVRSGGDQCRELVTKKLFFDLKELAHNKSDGAKIILLLKGFKEELTYVYKDE